MDPSSRRRGWGNFTLQNTSSQFPASLETPTRYPENVVNQLWRELVRCILAGGPVRGEAAYFCHSWLSRAFPESQDHRALLRNVQDSTASISQGLADSGYRFPNAKARSIISAAMVFTACEAFLGSIRTLEDAKALRLGLATLAWGIGLKTASHWLRNTGWDLPVIDRHVRRYLSRLVADTTEATQHMSYLDAESKMEQIARVNGIGPGVLDLHVWHHERGECQSLRLPCYACRIEGVR